MPKTVVKMQNDPFNTTLKDHETEWVNLLSLMSLEMKEYKFRKIANLFKYLNTYPILLLNHHHAFFFPQPIREHNILFCKNMYSLFVYASA